MDYKHTLNMPKTKFDMRGNLIQKEPLYRKKWLDMDLYNQILNSNDISNQFILHDGPPYANGDIHVGHALNKILKDIVIRYKSMSGFYSPYIPGWDTHGLPIEHKMLTEMKVKKGELSDFILRKKAQKYALKQVERQKKQFELLQLQSNLKDYYVTLDPNYEVAQIKLFQKMWNDKLIYKGLKPVYWSPSSQSALAEAEVEYADHDSPSIFVAFKISKGYKFIKPNDNLIIWTTTPWTLLANSGVAISDSIEYSLVEFQHNKYVIATKLVEKLVKEFNWKSYKILERFDHSILEHIKYESPFNKLECPVILGHHVTLEAGSGLVHIAPLFGEDDFLIGKKHNLKMIMHIEDDGKINSYSKQFEDQFYLDANSEIIKELIVRDILLSSKIIRHSFPHDWRTNQPIMYRGTPQWFVSISKIKNQILNAIKSVKFHSSWAQKRLTQMINNREDWTISRQRTWGVPIIAFYDREKNIILNDEIFEHVIDLVKKNGTDIWYQLETDELLPLNYRNQGFQKENDIMDVWFDSGVSFLGVEIANAKAPYDLYLEGSDQYRGWFNSSLINSVAYANQSPYKNLVSHGFVLDGKGQKMSKSKGNVVDPLTIIKSHGADILRLWVANSEFSNDITISDNILSQNVEIYRNIRNKLKFLLGNLNNYNYKKVAFKGVHALINNQLAELQKNVLEAYETFNFINVVKGINNYLLELSSFYLSITKDTLYVDDQNSETALIIKANLWEICDFVIKALAPIMPTTAEDAFEHFSTKIQQNSIHLSKFENPKKTDKKLLEQWKEFFLLRDKVNLEIEKSIKNKIVSRSNEAIIVLSINSSQFIKSLDLKTLLMVADVKFEKTDNIFVQKIDGLKCDRCWNHHYKTEMHNDICIRCFNVLQKGGFNV